MEEQWLPMKEVAKILNIPDYKLSRVAQKGSIKTKPDPVDGRVKLVEVSEVKRIFRIK
jgi:DNA-binding MarR family transcriptional regulator